MAKAHQQAISTEGTTATAGVVSESTRYRCIGDVRGWCHIDHRSYEAAERCISRDRRGCVSQGGYSDRTIVVRGSEGDNWG